MGNVGRMLKRQQLVLAQEHQNALFAEQQQRATAEGGKPWHASSRIDG